MNLKSLLLVEDEELLRTSLHKFLVGYGYRVCSHSSGKALLDLLSKETNPDEKWAVVIMDVHLEGHNGVQVQKAVRELGLRIPFVFMSAHQNAQDVNQAWRDGAHDFLFKPFTPDELLQAVERAMAANTAVHAISSPAIAQETLDKFNRLTPRQKEVLQLVATGLSNTQISERLRISARTVKMHRESMMHRFGFTHVTDLVRFHDACKGLF